MCLLYLDVLSFVHVISLKKSKKDKAMRNDSAGVTGRTLDMKLCCEGVREEA